MAARALLNGFLEQYGAATHQSRPASMATAFIMPNQTPGAPGGGVAAESDEAIAGKLAGVDKDIEQSGTRSEDIINTAFGHKVIKNGLPVIDVRNHDDIDRMEYAEMGSKYPGGDVMEQLMWQKWRSFSRLPVNTGVQVPPEEDWYAGARLGEYARPLVMGENRLGYLNQAVVPMSTSEDLLTLVGEAGVGSRRARHAALYAKASAGQAEEFFRLAQRRLRQVFRDPPLTVVPGGDVYPMYSASMGALLALPPPRRPTRHRHRHRARSAPAAQLRLRRRDAPTIAPKRAGRQHRHADFF